MAVDSMELAQSLPNFVTRLWVDPHKAFDSLNKNISKEEVRNLIKETAKNIDLENASDYRLSR
jgi:ribosomal protein L19E